MGLPGCSMQLSGFLGTVTSCQSLYEVYLGQFTDEETESDEEKIEENMNYMVVDTPQTKDLKNQMSNPQAHEMTTSDKGE